MLGFCVCWRQILSVLRLMFCFVAAFSIVAFIVLWCLFLSLFYSAVFNVASSYVIISLKKRELVDF